MIFVIFRNLIIEWWFYWNINFLLMFFIKKNVCVFIIVKVKKGVDFVINRLKCINFSGFDIFLYFIFWVYWFIFILFWFLYVKLLLYFFVCRVFVVGIEVFECVKGKWFCLIRMLSNFFLSEGMGVVLFLLKVRLISIMNE